MGGAKAVFHRPQQPVAGETIAFKSEHRIHQVLEHLGARQHPFFGDVAHQKQSDIKLFGQPLQRCRAFTHLSNRARRTAQISVMQGLDAVDHRHIRPQSFQLLEHVLQICFSQQLGPIPATTGGSQALPAQLHLLG